MQYFCVKVPLHIWGCFRASFVFPYATELLWTKLQYRWQGTQVWLKKQKPNQEPCKYQWLCHECKLQLSLTIPHLLLTRQANTSSCLAAKQSPHLLSFSQVTASGSQHTKAVRRDTYCSGEGDGEWERIRQGVNCTISARGKPSFKYVLKNSITANTLH